MKTKRALPVLAAASLAIYAWPAHAQDRAQCTAIELGATHAGAPSIPAELKPLEKKLKKSPLSSWNSFRVMSSSDFALENDKPSSPKLAAGATTIILKDVNAREGKRPRLSLSITMDGQSGKRIFDSKVNTDSGDFIVYGETLANDDGHFVALSCKL